MKQLRKIAVGAFEFSGLAAFIILFIAYWVATP